MEKLAAGSCSTRSVENPPPTVSRRHMKYSQRLRRHWLVALLALSTPALVHAQGTISGTVIERGTNSPIEGARVIVPGTRLGAATDAKGTYTIRGVTAGATVVRAQFIGYESQDVTVQLANNGT